MSFSDDAFDDLPDLDESAIAHIDAVESRLAGDAKAESTDEASRPPSGRILCPETPGAAGRTSKTATSRPTTSNGASTRPPPNGPMDPIELVDDDDDEWDDSMLGQLDMAENAAAAAGATTIAARAKDGNVGNAVAGPSRGMQRTASSGANYVQRTLFGDQATSNGVGIVTMSSQAGAGGTKKARQTKQWDRTVHAASGPRRITAPRPGRLQNTQQQRSGSPSALDAIDIEAFELDDIEEEDLRAPGPSRARPPPPRPPPDDMKLELDVEAAQTFLYPTNMAKRDYQFNIVQRALFDNVLVALPTGLGKTFIAAVVILNFFRWYPKGKIVFVAPTKPLVAQQQTACHGICGLPWDVACEMTGNTTKSRRGDEWEEKRIFYMTPQTLDNDIATGDVDPRDIICLVVDEAHRATGNYAYCNIVSQMQAVNPYFRILALTATPGSTSEKVQEVIDNLHISLIELRTEEALDIRQYIHKKREEPIVVTMTDDFRNLRDLYLEVMEENCNALTTHGLLPRCDAATLHPFRVRSIYGERKSILAQKRWLGATINETAKMADARHHLDTFSIKMFRARIQELLEGMKRQDSKKMKLAQVINLAASMPDEAHPKMIKCVDVILDHFSTELGNGNDSTRVMVFCSLREAVHEIVDLLNTQDGVKATPFVGQASDKRGRGLTQKEQQEIIQKFKKGDFNVIVATSIGEEGLDIGEVDLIVCYEAVKDSVRMLQRVGRTGRKREGRIVVLMTEGPESNVWQKSKDTYKGVQQTITAGHSVTLFDDVPRLVPPSIKPKPRFEELDQPEFEPAMISSKKAAGKSAKALEKAKKRRARLTDVNRNVPEGALLGFLKASAISRSLQEDDDDDDAAMAGPSRRRRGGRNQEPESLDDVIDDSDDEALERGLDFNRPALSRSVSANKSKPDEAAESRKEGNGTSVPPASKPITISSNDDGTSSGRRGRSLGARRTISQRRRNEDEESGSDAAPDSSPQPLILNRSKANTASAAKQQRPRSSAAAKTTAATPLVEPSPAPSRRATATYQSIDGDDDFSMSWANDDGLLAQLSQEATKHVQARPATTAAEKQKEKQKSQQQPNGSNVPLALQDSPSPDLSARRRGKVHPLMANILAEQQQPASATVSSTGSPRASASSSKSKSASASVTASAAPEASADDSSPIIQRRAQRPVQAQQAVPQSTGGSEESPLVQRRRQRVAIAAAGVPDSPLQNGSTSAAGLMGPPKSKPASKFRRAVAPPSSDGEGEQQNGARAAAQRKGKGRARDEEESDDSTSRPPAKKSKPKKVKQPRKRITNSPTSRAFFQHEADRDTDEERRARNRSDSNDEGLSTDEADTSDLEHVGDFEPTQAPRGYKQMNVYMQSLLTQQGGGEVVPGLKGERRRVREVGRQGPPPRGSGRNAQHQPPGGVVVRSSQGDDESDRYSFGSFVCEDDDVEYESDAEDSEMGGDDDEDDD